MAGRLEPEVDITNQDDAAFYHTVSSLTKAFRVSPALRVAFGYPVPQATIHGETVAERRNHNFHTRLLGEMQQGDRVRYTQFESYMKSSRIALLDRNDTTAPVGGDLAHIFDPRLPLSSAIFSAVAVAVGASVAVAAMDANTPTLGPLMPLFAVLQRIALNDAVADRQSDFAMDLRMDLGWAVGSLDMGASLPAASGDACGAWDCIATLVVDMLNTVGLYLLAMVVVRAHKRPLASPPANPLACSVHKTRPLSSKGPTRCTVPPPSVHRPSFYIRYTSFACTCASGARALDNPSSQRAKSRLICAVVGL